MKTRCESFDLSNLCIGLKFENQMWKRWSVQLVYRATVWKPNSIPSNCFTIKRASLLSSPSSPTMFFSLIFFIWEPVGFFCISTRKTPLLNTYKFHGGRFLQGGFDSEDGREIKSQQVGTCVLSCFYFRLW